MGLLAKVLPSRMALWMLKSLGKSGDDRFARVFEVSSDWIVITRLSDSLIIDANHGFETISGYSAAEVLGHPIMKFKVWVDAEMRTTLINELMTAGSFHNAHTQLRRRDGALRECVVSASLIALDGKDHSHAVWVVRDVTDAVQAKHALQESETRFALLFDKAPLAMCYASSHDGFASTQWNQTWFYTFGYRPETDQGRTGLDLNLWVNPHDRQSLIDLIRHGKTDSEMEVPLRHANGQIRQVSVSTRVFVEHERTLLVSSYLDITEQRQAKHAVETLNADLEARVEARTADLNAANEVLSSTLATLHHAKDQLVQTEKLAALGSIVAGVAHELNTPIGNGLTTASSLEHRVTEFSKLLDQGIRRSDLAQFVADTKLAAEILARNLDRAASLVTSFKQVAVDQTSAHRRPFNLNIVVAEILVTLNPVLRKAGCTVTIGIPGDLELNSYPGPLGQVLSNLINNAVVHAFDEGKHGTIAVTARAQGNDSLEIRVKDNGRGITPADVNRVFEPFFTTRLGQGGSGLGLHIAHNIVTGVLGGRISVLSAEMHGAEFVLTLPLRAPESPNDGS